MEYQQYHDMNLIHFQRFPYDHNNQFHRRDSVQLLPTSQVLRSDDINCEESIQPERGIAGFVSKLYQCLQAPDDGHKYARWCRHNGIDMFIIDCIPKFTEIVLPRLFKHCKFASFVRQLNIYGFQRDTDARKSKDSKDKETCRWYHTHFRPSRRDLFHLIRRKTPRYTRRKRPKNEEDDEDPETIIIFGSGDDESNNTVIREDDEEDNSTNSLDERRRSASSASSSIILQHLPQKSNVEYKPRQLQMISESPQEVYMDYNSYLSRQPMHHSSSTSSLDDQLYSQFSTSDAMVPLPTARSGLEPSSRVYASMQQTMVQDEEQLRAQIFQIQKDYWKMYHVLTGEFNKASNVINAQRSRIEFLENSLCECQQQHQHQMTRMKL